MYKVGLSSCGYELSEESFKGLKDAGIDALEISMHPDKYKDIDYKKVKELSERYEVELWSYHLPFYPMDTCDISALDRNVRKNTLKAYFDFIKKAADIGLDKFVVHPGAEPVGNEEREERIKYAMESLDILAEEAYKNGAKIAVEDLPRTCLGNTASEMERLIGANGKLGVCFDTNHLLIDTNDEFLKRLGSRIITVHISDYDYVNERHWLPGEGKVDWTALYEGLKKSGYEGVWMYEINLENPASVEEGRNLIFSDFSENAKCIFEGKPLPKVRKIKDKLGMWE